MNFTRYLSIRNLLLSFVNILLLDNYDSFTYNLYHYLLDFTSEVTVKRNDEIQADEADQYSHIVLSPGPGLPNAAGILMEMIDEQVAVKPILGVCLGMQALAEHFGGTLYNQDMVKHGVTTTIDTKPNSVLFHGLPESFQVGLYHSWAVDETALPKDFTITAKSTENVVMAIEHRSLPVCGVQFHPESILTEHGREILGNWLNR